MKFRYYVLGWARLAKHILKGARDMVISKDSPNAQVSRWLGDMRDVKTEMGLTQWGYSDAVILALIEVESGGDPDARGAGPMFCGLLQMGGPAGQDVGFADRGRDTTDALLGDGRLAIRKFLEYQERYKDRHAYQDDRIALLWKAGPGTARKVGDLLRRGRSLNAAIEEGSAGIPYAGEYIRRFRVARERWEAWLS